VGISPHAPRLLRFEGLEFANRQKDGNISRLRRLFQLLTDFQTAVTGHVDVENDEIGRGLGDTLEGSGTVIDRDDVVTGVSQDFSPHVLGCDTIISKQYFPRQELSFDTKGR
jgi:hypothetical protein